MNPFISFLKVILISLLFLYGSAFSAVSPMELSSLNVPKNLIALDSKTGRALFNKTEDKGSYWVLSRYFVTQKNTSYCAIASLTMVLNALQIKRPVSPSIAPYRLFTQTNIFYNQNLLKNFRPTKIDGHGFTLISLAKISKILNLKAQYFYADNQAGFKQFIVRAQHALNIKKEFVIVNFNRKLIGEVGSGHFSPIAAYNAAKKMFLIMDVARYKYPPTWVKASQLWKAMESEDNSDTEPRGYLILSKEV